MKWTALFAIVCTTIANVCAGPLDNWHSRTNFGYDLVRDIAYHDGVYVMISSLPGAIIPATNLVTPGAFAVHPVPDLKPVAIEYGAGRFVVASEGGAMLSSTNGYDWASYGASGPYSSMVFANGRFVAVGSRTAAASTNGVDWVTSQLPVFTQDVTFGNGVFLASGNTTNALSSDGIVWEQYVLPSRQNFYTIGFGAGKFVGLAIGSSGDNILTSTDGRNWTSHGRLEVVRPARVAWGNGYFVTVGNARAYSDDGISWTVVPSGKVEGNVEFVNGRFIAAGYQSLVESDPITQLVLLNSNTMQIRGVAGTRVQIETTDALNADWEAAPGWETIASDGAVTVELSGGGTQRFFRAVLSE